MSYYNIHPIFGHRASSPTPSPYVPLSPPGPRHPASAPSPFATDAYDLEAEERAALAHLRHIQQRREAQQAAIECEAALRYRAQEERELAIRRAIAEKRREQAIAEAIERQREQVAERARIQSAIEHHLRQQAEQQHRQRLVEQQQQQRAAQHQAAQQFRQQQIAQAKERATQCAAKYAQRATQQVAKEVKKEYKDEYAALNNLLGSLFGITLEDEDAKEVKSQPDSSAAPNPASAPSAPTPAPAPVLASTPSNDQAFPSDINNLLSHYLGLHIEPATSADQPKPAASAESHSAQSTNNVPAGLNELPAASAESHSAQSTNNVPAGLNELLSRFGLVFEPTEVEAPKPVAALPSASTPPAPAPVQDKAPAAPTVAADPPVPALSAPSTAPAPTPTPAAASSSAHPLTRPDDDHPLTTFLNGMADMPPFVRDILGNVEMAFKEERDRNQPQSQTAEGVKGKGKAVADGEKKVQAIAPTPAPVVAPTPPSPADNTAAALSTLSNISSDLDLVRRSFDFPSTLSFAAPSPDATSSPSLLFNKANSGYHAQAHKLLQLLLAADAITSDGNKDVRRKRKEVVREVEREIEDLEKRRDQVWEQVKAQRESGEVEAEVETTPSSSCSSSVVDPTEVKEEVEHHEEVQSEEVEGFKVPDVATPPSDHLDSATPPKPESADKAAKVEDTPEETATKEKDEGFELV